LANVGKSPRSLINRAYTIYENYKHDPQRYTVRTVEPAGEDVFADDLGITVASVRLGVPAITDPGGSIPTGMAGTVDRRELAMTSASSAMTLIVGDSACALGRVAITDPAADGGSDGAGKVAITEPIADGGSDGAGRVAITEPIRDGGSDGAGGVLNVPNADTGSDGTGFVAFAEALLEAFMAVALLEVLELVGAPTFDTEGGAFAGSGGFSKCII
jgi:hypothetical protein